MENLDLLDEAMAQECPDCTGIKKNPGHYNGEAATPERMAKCVLYEALTLAIAIQALRDQSWDSSSSYEMPEESFDPSEVLKSAGQMKIRILYDFLYNVESKDGINWGEFRDVGFSKPYNIPNLLGFEPNTAFTKKSINKFVAHLTKQRITKPKCIPQAKYDEGKKAVIMVGIVILQDVEKFITGLLAHKKFGGLDDWGSAYLDGFRKAHSRFEEAASD